ncbi:putative cation-transporting atpase [Operophtera brumata]|uniref:Putative cation-transporting atpase n=1 Tax=Operophtera brumata TaxID=104452 RepID=A0A0L7L8X9_OPEBR|nr:putative cation-transporting atpase [Operophtera brumata]
MTAVAMSKLYAGLELLALTGVEDRLAENVPRTLAMLRTAGIKRSPCPNYTPASSCSLSPEWRTGSQRTCRGLWPCSGRLESRYVNERTAVAMSKLYAGLELLALTGVENRLAENVPRTLAMLRTAGIKIWMLTGDKLETALCIARSLHLGGGTAWLTARACVDRRDAYALLESLRRADSTTDLIIEGETLEVCLQSYEEEFVEVLQNCSGVVVARCSPTQKARVARLLRCRGHVVAAVGDGGNDKGSGLWFHVQYIDVRLGVGIEGAEGRSASLAGDVSIRQFLCLARLLLAVFSVVFYFSSVSLYPGFLMVLDKDIPSATALRYPQLYKQLTRGRQLSYKTFYIWTGISIYQGFYTALILTELIMVALTVVTWHALMAAAELVSLALYVATLLIFTTYFDGDFIRHWDFWWKVITITLISCLPLYIVKHMHRKWSERQYKNIRV